MSRTCEVQLKSGVTKILGVTFSRLSVHPSPVSLHRNATHVHTSPSSPPIDLLRYSPPPRESWEWPGSSSRATLRPSSYLIKILYRLDIKPLMVSPAPKSPTEVPTSSLFPAFSR